MSVIWKSVGPILLLQVVVAFIVLGWPALRSIAHKFARGLERLFPVDPEIEDTQTASSASYRGKWRDAHYQGKDQTDRGSTQGRDDQQSRRAQNTSSISKREYYLHCLGLRGDVSRSEVKRAYRRRAKELHPDRLASGSHSQAERDQAVAKMQELNEAYDWLLEQYARTAT